MAGGVFSEALLFAMTIRESATDGSDFTNPAADYRRLFLGEDGLLHLKDSAGTVTDVGAGGSGSITASGYTQNTARLLGRTTAAAGAIEEITVGSGLSLAAGSLTATGGSGIASGTSFPGSPAADDLFYRTDRDILYFYDGARWLSEHLYREKIGDNGSITGSLVLGRAPAWVSGTTDIWVDALWVSYSTGATNDGSNYWDYNLRKLNSAIAATTLVTITTSGDAANTGFNKTATVGALLGSYVWLDSQALKTGAASNATASASFSYRLVG